MKVLQTPSKQSKLLTNVPKVTADIIEEQVEDIKPSNSSAISVYSDVSHSTFDLGTDQASTSHDSDSSGSPSKELMLTTSYDISSDADFVPPRANIGKRNKMVAERKFNKPVGKKIVIKRLKTEAGKTIRKKKDFHQVPWIRTTSSPRTLSNAIRSLNDAQRQSVIDMGFKGILNLSFEEIPSKMGYWVVDNFDERTCTIRMEHASLEITKKSIHQILGVPMGGLQINTTCSSKQLITKTSQEIKEGKTQFGKEGLIRPTDIVEQIQTVGRMFKINFLTSKATWNREDRGTYYTGPLTLLTLFYVDSTMCQRLKVSRKTPAIKGWTSELLKKRELVELKLGGFGKGSIELPLDVDEIEDDGTKNLEGDTTEADTAKDKEADNWVLYIKEEMIEDMNEDESDATWCDERQGNLILKKRRMKMEIMAQKSMIYSCRDSLEKLSRRLKRSMIQKWSWMMS